MNKVAEGQVSAFKAGTVTGISVTAAEFAVSWVRDSDPSWAWPESSDTMAMLLIAAAAAWAWRTWAHYRSRMAGKSVIPMGDKLKSSALKLKDVIGPINGFDSQDK